MGRSAISFVAMVTTIMSGLCQFICLAKEARFLLFWVPFLFFKKLCPIRSISKGDGDIFSGGREDVKGGKKEGRAVTPIHD